MERSAYIPAFILLSSPVWMLLTMVVSVLHGAKSIEPQDILNALIHFDAGDVNHQIVMHSRIPRVIGALLIGAFLAMSGALMQGMTRNVLASPSIMGVTDGSAFAITLGMVFIPYSSSMDMIVYSMIGSAFGVFIVLGLGALLPGGLSPVRLAIIGTIFGTFLSSVSAAIATYFQYSQSISYWYNSRLHLIDPALVKLAIPFALAGVVAALLLSRPVTILSLGEDVAVGLGQKTVFIRVAVTAAVVVLTGISVALAGKIAFVGLIVPHITRYLVGVDYRRIIPCAGVLGALFLAWADLLSRFLNHPFETPVGVVTALIGVPFFLYLARTRGGARHA